MRNSVLVLLFLLLAARLFLLGVQHNFPGDTLAHYLEQQAAAHSSFQLKIAPLAWKELRHITTDQVAWVAPPSLPLFYLFVMENVEMDLLPFLQWEHFPFFPFAQEVALHGKAYGGEIFSQVNYGTRERAELNIQAMSLDLIPAVHLIPYVDLRGKLDLQGVVENLQELETGQSQIPQGQLVATLENVTLQAKDLEAWMPSWLDLPALSFPKIELEADSKEFLTLHKLQFTGAVEGTIDGKIFLNPQNLPASTLQLRVRLKLSQAIKETLGPMVLLLQRMQCGEVLDFDLSGTFRQLNPPSKRACS